MLESLRKGSAAVRAALDTAARGLVDREILVDLVALAAVAGEHLLVLGPPGTAKSQAVRRVARALGGRYFEYLLGRFTEPSEIVGPIDLRRLRDGVIETQTAGMLRISMRSLPPRVLQSSPVFGRGLRRPSARYALRASRSRIAASSSCSD